MLKNDQAKRTKFLMKMKYKNLILLSGTPVSGKYELLWPQMYMLGWNISKRMYWSQFVNVKIIENQGFPIKIVSGYKNIDRLKNKMREHGCRFLKTDDVFDLPEQNFIKISVPVTKEYEIFRKKSIVKIDGRELIGDSTFSKMQNERTLCCCYNDEKLQTVRDLLRSCDERFIIFYNFWTEFYELEKICSDVKRPLSFVNGREKNLDAYEKYENSVTLIQYQSGAMGLNLQKCRRIIYFSPTLSSELYEQSKKRIHRIGQSDSCFYYLLICKNSIEEKVYRTLDLRRNYTEELFENDY